MNNLDFPFSRYSVGFDRLFRLLDNTASLERNTGSYPPYNIEETDENSWEITLAVAGFAKNDIEITEEQGLLRIKATNSNDETTQRQWVHRGIASRSFERRFNLANHVKVKKASMENGLLTVKLEREVPEVLKPKQIDIQDNYAEEKLLEDHAAA